ncbi:nucleotidyltransferase domain-containing protein [Microlunatus parietis]|uniref:Putative nucleotidyltransferase n=1 Tax=Microlunatus parietis TaxID=682979 RepID=A0A7Y9I943_9ACTN|nr:hypothetical protein [Microlunatus parietis]NYE72611.1 putative nucleotidyltransferase [Microlunatus parietis]
MGPELIESTGDRRCDLITQGLIGIFEIAFPDRVLGVYLRGSHASGASIDGSDLDLYVLFHDQFVDRAEFDRARALADHCARLSPVLLEIIVIGERVLRLPEAVSTALDFKLGTRLVYGTDVRPGLPEFEPDSYRRSVIHTPFNSYRFPSQRGDAGALTYPLEHLDPAGAFFGFEQWAMPGPDGIERPSTKLLVATVGWTATAIIALRTGLYVRDKAACADLYRREVADEMLYRDYQEAELASGDPDRQRLAERRLAEVSWPDPVS